MAATVRVDPPPTVLTLIMLALVALLPAATRITHGHGFEHGSMVIYAGAVVAIGFSLSLMWGWAALVADLVSPEAPYPVRWWLLALIVVPPPLVLYLIKTIPYPPAGGVPLARAVLFIIGWPMRLCIVRRPAPKTAAD